MKHKCPICGSDDNFVFTEGIFDCENTCVIECNSCEVQFLHRIMTEEEETEFYKNYYKSQESRQFKKMDMQAFQDRSLELYCSYKDLFYNLLKPHDKILEIGCGSGGFIRFMLDNFDDKNKSKNIFACEKSQSNLEFLKKSFADSQEKVKIFETLESIKEIGQTEEKFDLICAFGLLEHIRDTVPFLKKIKSLLKDDCSEAVFIVPNKYAPLVYLFELEEFKKFAYMKMHYYTFSEKSLHILAEASGLKVSGIKYIQAYGLDNTLSWLKNRKPHEYSKFTDFLSKETINSFNNDLIKNKMTDLMVVILKKNVHAYSSQ